MAYKSINNSLKIKAGKRLERTGELLGMKP
jgi:hypothetical protein